ncbi:MAG TPA: DR2241 family protein [Longimicrobiaceae bacterium]|nr:DR2241 family protein [Longimicrobiaceae bacterium]
MPDTLDMRGAHAPGGVAAAREALLAWVGEGSAEGRVFLEVRLLAGLEGEYEVRHAADTSLPLESLQTTSDPYAAREIAQTTAAGEHRPLKTAPNLRRGWALVALDARGLWTALDYLYPACAVHWHAGREGTLRVTHWQETAGRQSGIYSAVGLLPNEAVRNTAWACCADVVCLRRVAWEIDAETPLGVFSEEKSVDGARVPCPEPCSLFISLARKVLSLERSPRQAVEGLGTLGKGEVEQLKKIVTAAATGTLVTARDGEFTEPLNLRRIRYLAARLEEAS